MSNEPSLDALINHPFVQAMRQAQEEENRHIHGPFTFLISEKQVLRGCQACGATWIGFIGNYDFPISVTWRYVEEEEGRRKIEGEEDD